MMKESVDICKQHLENETCKSKRIYVGIKYAQILAAYGIVLRYELPPDEMDKALECLNEALKLQNSTLEDSSINRIRTLYYIGCAYQKQGQVKMAREKMTESLQLIERVDPGHPYKASICTGLGRLLQKDDPYEAEKRMKEAFAIRKNREKFSSEAHWKVAFAYQDVGEMLRERGSKLDAFQDFLKANNMFERLIERESSEYEEWLDSRSSSAPDYGIDIIDRWKKYQEDVSKEMCKLLD